MPNLAREPSSAISSVGIWPVDRNATDSGPCSAWIAFTRSVNVVSAVSQPTGTRRPLSVRSNGVVARSGASRTVSASHPFGHAMPRLTG